jgi:hypothetical protein
VKLIGYYPTDKSDVARSLKNIPLVNAKTGIFDLVEFEQQLLAHCIVIRSA